MSPRDTKSYMTQVKIMHSSYISIRIIAYDSKRALKAYFTTYQVKNTNKKLKE